MSDRPHGFDKLYMRAYAAALKHYADGVCDTPTEAIAKATGLTEAPWMTKVANHARRDALAYVEESLRRRDPERN